MPNPQNQNNPSTEKSGNKDNGENEIYNIVENILKYNKEIDAYKNIVKIIKKLHKGENVDIDDLDPILNERVRDRDKYLNKIKEQLNKLINASNTNSNNNFCKIIGELKKIANKPNITNIIKKEYHYLLDLCYTEEKCKKLIRFIDDFIHLDNNNDRLSKFKEIFKLFVFSYEPKALFKIQQNNENKPNYRDECMRLALSICDTLYSVSRLYNKRNNEQNKKYYFPCVPMRGDILLLAYYLIYNGINKVDADKIEFTVRDDSSNLEMRFSINSNLCQ